MFNKTSNPTHCLFIPTERRSFRLWRYLPVNFGLRRFLAQLAQEKTTCHGQLLLSIRACAPLILPCPPGAIECERSRGAANPVVSPLSTGTSTLCRAGIWDASQNFDAATELVFIYFFLCTAN